MALGFVLGKASHDKQAVMLAQLATWYQEEPKQHYFYLVPNHIKFESEVQVLDFLRQKFGHDGVYAAENVQIFSFSRLAWYFLKDHPKLQARHLSQTGLTMMVQHILHQRDDLVVFAAAKNQPGFAAQLTSQLIELRQGGYTSQDLVTMAQDLAQKPNLTRLQTALQEKLAELAKIYADFEALDQSQYVDVTVILTELKTYLTEADLSDTVIFIDGFTDFTALEEQIILLLAQKAKEVRVSLDLTKEQARQKEISSRDMYAPAYRRYWSLYRQAIKAGIPVLYDDHSAHLRVQPDLLALEKVWEAEFSHQQISDLSLRNNQALQAYHFSDRVSEVRFVASQVRQLVAREDYAYRDILVLTPDIEKYRNLLVPLFQQAEIPTFTDLSRSMQTHPFVEFMTSLLEFEGQNGLYPYQLVMRLLKTELIVPELYVYNPDYNQQRTDFKIEHGLRYQTDATGQRVYEYVKKRSLGTYRDNVDWLENFLLRTGISSQKRWEDDQVWEIEGRKSVGVKRLHDLNGQIIRQTLVHLRQRFSQILKTTQTGRQFAVALMELLNEMQIPQTLVLWQQTAQNLRADASDASRPKEVWDAFCNLLDEYVLALGDESFNLASFSEILQSGFNQATYNQVPSTLDQVIFSKTGIEQMQNRKITFILGLNADVFPQTTVTEGLLGDLDRELLAETSHNLVNSESKHLNDRPQVQLDNEIYWAYRAFMTGQDRLYLTAASLEVTGEKLELSPYLLTLVEKYGLELQTVNADQVETLAGSPQSMLTDLINYSRQHFGQVKVPATWRVVYQNLKAKLPLQVDQLFQSLTYRNEILPGVAEVDGHKHLDQELVDELYRKDDGKIYLFGSVSALETYFENPYEYFLKYGLKLQPRQEFKVDAAKTGTYFHEILEVFIRTVQETGQTIGELSSEQFDQIMQTTFAKVQANLEERKLEVFDSTHRYQNMRKRLNKTAYKVAQSIWDQRKQVPIVTLQTETPFGDFGGRERTLNGLILPPYAQAGAAGSLNLRGRIDRIDVVAAQLADQKQLFLNLVDYKSGNIEGRMKDFYVKAYHGLTLQLLTYLATLQMPNNQPLLAEMFANLPVQLRKKLGGTNQLDFGSVAYLQLNDPILKFADFKQKQKDLPALFAQNHRYSGLLRQDDSDFLRTIDAGLSQDAKSGANYQIKATKKGLTTLAGSHLVTPEQLQLLIQLDLLKLEEARQEILGGVIDLAPYRLGQQSGLQYSDYQDIMTFDSLVGNEYRELSKLSDEEMWQLIKAKVEREGKNE
ncbi:PD-(D/E)XK nuclease family protein [Ligilactobacillus equi]|uniref:PD-(D/E)XK nuclease family protein n=2 Tax=Ligilactobacillus equi TaxID=137357 RepID=UPI000705100E|nr:PD-(D/E)XK nuclease family protein [Ligilactobacillus equi]